MKPARSNRSAFTLIEIMMVVAIMVIAISMSWPSIAKIVNRAPLTQATQDVMEACRKARAMAILHGEAWELRITPMDGQMVVEKVPADVDPTLAPNSAAAAAPAPPVYAGDEPKPPDTYTSQISDRVHIDLLDVNFVEYKDMDVARVRFSPNGTSDDFTIIMSSEGDYRQVSLEVVTGLAEVESDHNKFGRAK